MHSYLSAVAKVLAPHGAPSGVADARLDDHVVDHGQNFGERRAVHGIRGPAFLNHFLEEEEEKRWKNACQHTCEKTCEFKCECGDMRGGVRVSVTRAYTSQSAPQKNKATRIIFVEKKVHASEFVLITRKLGGHVSGIGGRSCFSTMAFMNDLSCV